ncbi:hypothetical protein H0A36_28670 [Endozoicomonas sp. SM1973]|uniref:Uncharacterized protein n=1 Tax=Spartinivicinus marinus TaxID=2994442 RepID=A0A853IDR0_9GAMM|nr:hypothetical protein [Spartinivicinus marinus]MCX4024764.1 hypothetical protein [Spartinivicinus marinus]NYZ69992.1 hypothetical protein [Spartinivicinus marinus]
MPTREGIQKHWEVIEAFKNGKEIESYCRREKEWLDEDFPTFNYSEEFRIKPEEVYKVDDFVRVTFPGLPAELAIVANVARDTY